MVTWYGLTLVLIICTYLLRRARRRQPPSPFALPIIGHLYLLNSAKAPIHRTLQALSSKYGPIMCLRLGLRRVILLSSASAVEACFPDHDVALSNRPKTLRGEIAGYNSTTIGWCEYGDHWRHIRRVTAQTMFSSASIRKSGPIRNSEIRIALHELFNLAQRTGKARVDLHRVIAKLALRIAGRMVNGTPMENIDEYFKPGTLLTVLDYLPFLRWIGYGGIEKKVAELYKEKDGFFQGLIDEYRRKNGNSDRSDSTIVGALLALQAAEPEVYTENFIKGILAIMFSAGLDPPVRSMEWAIALLLNHPEVFEKVRKEIDDHMKPGELIDDSDIPKLTYLHCVMCEALRLFPVAPFLIPHSSSEDVVVNGYKIPKDTIILMNAWAIHRDPKVWEDPDEFRPERFLSGEAERDGFKFMPFGVGRRICPGEALGVRFIGLVLGALIQCFDWDRVETDLEDLTEGYGEVTLSKGKTLEALCSPRPSMVSFLSQL